MFQAFGVWSFRPVISVEVFFNEPFTEVGWLAIGGLNGEAGFEGRDANGFGVGVGGSVEDVLRNGLGCRSAAVGAGAVFGQEFAVGGAVFGVEAGGFRLVWVEETVEGVG